jgi:nitric-oxide synthase, bacterial
MPDRSGCPFLAERSIGDHRTGTRDRDGSGRESSTWAEARAYLELFHRETGIPHRLADRLEVVRREIDRTGTYWQTVDELTHGARVAWRNSNRCIGRLYWESLRLRDMRHLATAEEIFVSCVEHLREAYNGGTIRPVITVFPPAIPGRAGIRIWNPQLIRYAGYRQADGSVVGDPLHCALTDAVRALGWRGGAGTPFDVLPLVIQVPGHSPRLFELPSDAVVEVPLVHPVLDWFAALGLKWHAVPALSGMRLEIGGVNYTAAPFNGWYMGTEIGARDFGDASRYNVLPVLAEKMGLDTRSERSLWIDRALLEMNVAVNHSFAMAKVSLVDHHTAARHFMRHIEREQRARRAITGQWNWLVPPMSGSTTPVFHRGYKNTTLKPNFFYQEDPWVELMPNRRPADVPDGIARPHGPR